MTPEETREQYGRFLMFQMKEYREVSGKFFNEYPKAYYMSKQDEQLLKEYLEGFCTYATDSEGKERLKVLNMKVVGV